MVFPNAFRITRFTVADERIFFFFFLLQVRSQVALSEVLRATTVRIVSGTNEYALCQDLLFVTCSLYLINRVAIFSRCTCDKVG